MKHWHLALYLCYRNHCSLCRTCSFFATTPKILNNNEFFCSFSVDKCSPVPTLFSETSLFFSKTPLITPLTLLFCQETLVCCYTGKKLEAPRSALTCDETLVMPPINRLTKAQKMQKLAWQKTCRKSRDFSAKSGFN